MRQGEMEFALEAIAPARLLRKQRLDGGRNPAPLRDPDA